MTYQNSSLSYGNGSFSPSFLYFWQVSWSVFGPEVLDWIQQTLNKGGEFDAHINWDEFLAGIINLATSITAFEAYPQNWMPWPPKLLLIGDNKKANNHGRQGQV